MYFYPRKLSALPHDCLPTLEPGARSRISARFMAPGHETPRARQGGAPRAGGRSPRPSGDVRAEPLCLKGSPETRGVPSSGAGPSQNETCSGGGIGRKSRAGTSTINYFRFGRTRVYITPISLHRVKIIGSLGNEPQQSIVQAVVSYIHLFHLRPSFLSCLPRSYAGHFLFVFVLIFRLKYYIKCFFSRR